MPNDNGNWRDTIRAAQAIIWILVVLGVCGLLYVLSEVSGRPVQW